MTFLKRVKKRLKQKTWHTYVPRKHKKIESDVDFLERIVRMAATRCTMASWACDRIGSHSGRKVATTNITATATVAACAKMSQSLCMEGGRR